ncbi:uncharacterized protein LOC128746025 [Sabethes cyaneus]|uniref:uncharacterized protein LOC128746025 n=1 Tax=Sabethes cyaneus TaxID=53552 RepID=UPI00237DD2EB|nr:uncharacterized protein LOC128746025 [Sabethes cyaneus]
MTSNLLLTYPNFEEPFILTTDASNVAIGKQNVVADGLSRIPKAEINNREMENEVYEDDNLYGTSPVNRLLLLTKGQADIYIHDIRRNPIVILPIGTARICNSYLRIIHPIDLDPIELTINDLYLKAQEKIVNDKVLNPIIRSKIEKLSLSFRKIKIVEKRVKRWDSLGTGWKYISGSPDADDLRLVNATINTIIDQENNQIKINSGLDVRIRNITYSINSLISRYNDLSSDVNEGFSSINLLLNMDELTQQIETIGEAITLARWNIPSSRLISLKELTVAQTMLKEQGLDIATAESVLEIARAYVITTKNSIRYILRIPKLTNEIYSLYQIEPTISNGTRIHLEANYYLNGTTPYSTRSTCDRKIDQFICHSNQLEPPSKCIQKLMSGSSAHCPMEKIYGHNIIKRINDATIIINEANIVLKSNCSMHNSRLEGSYLIQFSKCAILLDGEQFTNTNVEIPSKAFIPTTGLKVLHMAHRDDIHHLNLTSESIHTKIQLLHWISFGSISVSTLVVIGITLSCVIKILLTKKATIVIQQGNQETNNKDEANPLGGSTRSINMDHPTRQPRFIPQ